MYHRWQNEKFQWQLVQHHVLKNLHHPQAQQQVKGINFPAPSNVFECGDSSWILTEETTRMITTGSVDFTLNKRVEELPLKIP